MVAIELNWFYLQNWFYLKLGFVVFYSRTDVQTQSYSSIHYIQTQTTFREFRDDNENIVVTCERPKMNIVDTNK